MRPPSRSAVVRGARFLVVLVVLAWPWPGLGRAYVGAFSRMAQAMAAPLFAGSGVRLSLAASPVSDEHHEWFSMVSVEDERTGAHQHTVAVDLRRGGYLQIALFLAAAAAFPMRRWRRFAAGLAVGLATLPMLAWLSIAMYLAKRQIIHLGSVSYSVLAVIYRSFVAAPGMSIAVPGLLWLLLLYCLEPSAFPAFARLSNPAARPARSAA